MNDHIIDVIYPQIQGVLDTSFHITLDGSQLNIAKKPIDYYVSPFSGKEKGSQMFSITEIEDILRIHDKSDLAEYLKILAFIEASAKKLLIKNRDHVVHAFNTFLLGVYVLSKSLPDGTTIEEKEFAWKLCGPLHDIGYPYELGIGLSKEQCIIFNECLKSSSISIVAKAGIHRKEVNDLLSDSYFIDLIEKRIKRWKININVRSYIDEIKRSKSPDHGVIGAFLQMKMLYNRYITVN